jgi:predicted metal-dependent HD superfamily phosphohydrolase
MKEKYKLQRVNSLVKNKMGSLPYHNYSHALDVVEASKKLAKLEQISSQDAFLIETAAYLHDVVHDTRAKDNEERSVEISREFLRGIGYTTHQIQIVSGLILATKLPTNPTGLLQQIICDADVDNLGREDFLEKTEALRKEFGIDDKKGWYANTLGFLKSHKYYTGSARDLRQKGLEKNISRLKKIVRGNNETP